MALSHPSIWQEGQDWKQDRPHPLRFCLIIISGLSLPRLLLQFVEPGEGFQWGQSVNVQFLQLFCYW